MARTPLSSLLLHCRLSHQLAQPSADFVSSSSRLLSAFVLFSLAHAPCLHEAPPAPYSSWLRPTIWSDKARPSISFSCLPTAKHSPSSFQPRRCSGISRPTSSFSTFQIRSPVPKKTPRGLFFEGSSLVRASSPVTIRSPRSLRSSLTCPITFYFTNFLSHLFVSLPQSFNPNRASRSKFQLQKPSRLSTSPLSPHYTTPLTSQTVATVMHVWR